MASLVSFGVSVLWIPVTNYDPCRIALLRDRSGSWRKSPSNSL